jgi:hypothetical protein
VFDSFPARVWFAVGSMELVLVLVLVPVLRLSLLPVIFVQRHEIKVLSERTARTVSTGTVSTDTASTGTARYSNPSTGLDRP